MQDITACIMMYIQYVDQAYMTFWTKELSTHRKKGGCIVPEHVIM